MSFENHIDIYADRYAYYEENQVSVYYQGVQSEETQQRYERITKVLASGYLEKTLESLKKQQDFSMLSDDDKSLLKQIVEEVTSEKGRALVGLTFLQLVIKSIAPEQCIRLHKGSKRPGSFSWVDGISMRTLDSNYCVPFLRDSGLLSVNKYGVFMTRSLAENYPYSSLYKAEMRGAFKDWLKFVDSLESKRLPPKKGLLFFISLLKNRSEKFRLLVEETVRKAQFYQIQTFDSVKNLLIKFFNETTYSARAFEVVVHSFMQALVELGWIEQRLVPLSQMRSANKKHGNIGDVELLEGADVVESWDAKYGKPYLRDELEELREKIASFPSVRLAGFITDATVDRRKDVVERIEEISVEYGVVIKIQTFSEWLDSKISSANDSEKVELASHWLLAVVESFAQKRPEVAPIDEPCEQWLEDIGNLLN